MATKTVNPEDFVIQYPGVYHGAAKDAMDKYFAKMELINNTTVSVEDIISGKVGEPKVGAVLQVTEAMVRYNSEKYAPEYGILHDADLAKKYGYKDIMAMPAFAACDEIYMQATPPEARDTLLVSQLCHEVECYEDVYPGDTVYMVRDKVVVNDLTPVEGSIYRHLHQENYGTIYKQTGAIVAKVKFTTMESVKVYKEECLPKPRTEINFGDIWEAPDWNSRPAHYYTEEDYETLKEIWRNECTQGEEPLYWEDVNVGDKPAPSAFGPILESVLPVIPYGMGVGGCRTLKKELLDPELAKTLVKNKVTGIYASPDPEVNVPAIPDGATGMEQAEGMPGAKKDSGEVSTTDIHKAGEDRSALINFMTRDIALGHILGYIGYHGKIHKICWSIMSPSTHAAMGKPVPKAEAFEIFTQRIPGMEQSDVPVHGLTDDVAVIRSYVVDKYVSNGRYMIKLVYSAETLEGDAWNTGMAEIELPSKNI